MLTRRSFLRKAGLAAGAALVARKVPKLKQPVEPLEGRDIQFNPIGKSPAPESFPNLGENSARWDAVHYTLYLDESALEAAAVMARQVRELFDYLPVLDDILITPETLRAANEAWAQRVSDA